MNARGRSRGHWGRLYSQGRGRNRTCFRRPESLTKMALFRPVQRVVFPFRKGNKRPPRGWNLRGSGPRRLDLHGLVKRSRALGIRRACGTPRLARDWAVDRGPRSHPLDGSAGVPDPVDGRLGADQEPLRDADLDKNRRPGPRALGAATRARLRRQPALHLRRIPLRGKAPQARRDGGALHRRRDRRAALQAPQLRPRPLHRRERYARLRERPALPLQGRQGTRALLRPRRLLGAPLRSLHPQGRRVLRLPASRGCLLLHRPAGRMGSGDSEGQRIAVLGCAARYRSPSRADGGDGRRWTRATTWSASTRSAPSAIACRSSP